MTLHPHAGRTAEADPPIPLHAATEAGPDPSHHAPPLPAASESVRRICVFRALKLGDMVCATPALRALRGRFPAAHITWVGLPWAADLARRLGAWVDAFEPFPGHPELPERRAEADVFEAWAEGMRAQHFDLAMQLHGSGPMSNRIVAALGARHTVGFHLEGTATHEAARGLTFWPYPQQLHEIHRNLRLVRHLGADDSDDAPSFPLEPGDVEELRSHPDLRELLDTQEAHGSRCICLHPGARAVDKRWPPGHFAQVGDALAQQGFGIVITGDASEHGLAESVRRQMHAPALNAARDLSVGALAALLSRARLLVSNDTGVAHIASALALPSVVVFFATDPQRWAPLDRARHRCVRAPAGEGVSGVAADTVLRAAEAQLSLWAPQDAPAQREAKGQVSPDRAASHPPAAAHRRAAAPAQ